MATWGVDNRTTALRVIPGSPSSTRVEYRFAAADINPYIAMAASVASGLYGIENELPLPPETVGNGYDAKAQPLPSTLRLATDALAASKEAREILKIGVFNRAHVEDDVAAFQLAAANNQLASPNPDRAAMR